MRRRPPVPGADKNKRITPIDSEPYRDYLNHMETICTTYPYEASPGVARHQCTECGGWERSDKGAIRHSKGCDSKAQVSEPAVRLAAFARDVRRTALTKGRDNDVLDAVRRGYLSESDAMNTDD